VGVTAGADRAGSALSPDLAAPAPRETRTGTPVFAHAVTCPLACPMPTQAPCQPRYTSPLDLRDGPCDTGPHHKRKACRGDLYTWKMKGFNQSAIFGGIHASADSNPT